MSQMLHVLPCCPSANIATTRAHCCSGIQLATLRPFLLQWAPTRDTMHDIQMRGLCRSRVIHRGLCVRLPRSSYAVNRARCRCTVHGVAPDAQITHLECLLIQNFALVSDQTVTFTPGLNVISGESGAGKSVLLQALQVVMGMPAAKDMIRKCESRAVIEAGFLLGQNEATAASSLLRALGLPSRVLPEHNGGKLALRREITRVAASARGQAESGSDTEQGDTPEATCARSAVFINGAATPLRNVRTLGAALVDVNGQNAAIALRSPSTQRALLDRLARAAPLAARCGALLRELTRLRGRIADLADLEDEELRRGEEEALHRIESLQLQPGEEDVLRDMLQRLDARAAAVESCEQAHASIGHRGGDERTLLGLLCKVDRRVARVRQQADAEADAAHEALQAGHLPLLGADTLNAGGEGGPAAVDVPNVQALADAASQLQQAAALLEGGQERLQEYVESLEYDPEAYAAAKQRMHAINELLEDCGCASTRELLAAAADTRSALARWGAVAEELPVLRAEASEAEAELQQTAVRLSTARRRASGHLRQAVEGNLARLCMEQSRFDVRIGWEPADAAMAATALRVPPELAVTVGEEGGRLYRAGEGGLDRVEFLLAPGPAEPLQPLQSVASGGESSRVMLALKAAPASAAERSGASQESAADAPSPPGVRSPPPTTAAGVLMVESQAAGLELYPLTGSGGREALFDADTAEADSALAALAAPVVVLDEIDAGTGARLGGSVGRMLHGIAAASGQVLCVSHVPQVAAYADHHVLVEKHMHDGRPLTTFRGLRDEHDRVAEVAAMMDLDHEVARRLPEQAAQDLAQHSTQHADSQADAAMEEGAGQAGGALSEGMEGGGMGEDGSWPAALRGAEHSALGSEALRPA
eukprot:jgi/Ulvmu1/1775/UM118_0015.1